ncbi:GuaB3 family IMP dehydrogenase-related protein [bacterium]|nr:GuaB3 family IMP dehydrogenase-related protein [bacterium]
MDFLISKKRRAKLALGFDDISLAPSASTIDPEDTNVSWRLGEREFELPIIAAAMDSVVDPGMAARFTGFGSFGVLNLEGVWGRYQNPREILAKIARATDDEATPLLQEVYSAESVNEKYIARSIRAMKDSGALAAVSLTPLGVKRFWPVAKEEGAELLVVQSTVTSPKHKSSSGEVLNIADLCSNIDIPLIVGNCVGYNVAIELMRAGADGILIGVGPGQACTTRDVTGVGVPQITATAEAADARDDYFEESGRRVTVITDGGMRTSGQVAKCLAAGADAVMFGSVFTGCPDAPAHPYHWGMAAPHPNLPRGTRVRVDSGVPLEQVLFGPARVSDGTQNIVGGIKSSMGLAGAATIEDFHETELYVSLSFRTEGKGFQMSQKRSI